MMRFRIWLVGIVVASAGPLGAQEPLAMKVSPAVAFAPADLILRATVEPHSRNRVLEIVAESVDYYRSSEIQLDGERAPRTTLVEYRSVPGGLYTISARLKGTGGRELAVTRHDVNIIESGSSLR